MNMKLLLGAALMLSALSANALSTVNKNSEGGLVVEELKTKKVTATDEGAGCRTKEELRFAYNNRNVLHQMYGTKRCALIEKGDKLDLVEGSHDKEKGIVQIYGGFGVFFYVPAYVFGLGD